MFKKLKKVYVNFTVAFAVPLIVFSNVSGVYNGWRERQYEMFDKRELCAKLVKEGAVSQKFCDEEIKYETGPQAEFDYRVTPIFKQIDLAGLYINQYYMLVWDWIWIRMVNFERWLKYQIMLLRTQICNKIDSKANIKLVNIKVRCYIRQWTGIQK